MISSLAVGFLAFLSFHVILYILIFYVLSLCFVAVKIILG